MLDFLELPPLLPEKDDEMAVDEQEDTTLPGGVNTPAQETASQVHGK